MPRKKGKSVLVTGGCGFIGSHLVDALLDRGNEVTVLDNLSSSTTEYAQPHLGKKEFRFVEGDIRDFAIVRKLCSDIDIVLHFAAQPDVRLSLTQSLEDHETNVKGTLNILEGMRTQGVPSLIFASTSTVYGQATVIPTPEDHPIAPISNYGASKSACEVYMMSYSSCYNMSCVSLRYANIFGPRSTHGVIYEFFRKLRKNPNILEILGDGKQVKSYLYITDCVEATLLTSEKAGIMGRFGAYNIGSNEKLEVNEIAKIVVDELKIPNVKFTYTGGRQGWIGDVPDMLLDTKKITMLGWKPQVDVREGIRRYVRWLKDKFQ
nr:SDR family NAD(P)-dependent oxidoreductase [Candidatus Njordarchaeota archaeon]